MIDRREILAMAATVSLRPDVIEKDYVLGWLQPVYHPYSDEPEGGIKALCYVYEEVFGEKFRALAERTRPRDLYDVVNLFRNSTIKPAAGVLLDILRQKCEFKGIAVPVLADLESHKESLEGSWASMLGHQLPNLPPVESSGTSCPPFLNGLNMDTSRSFRQRTP